MRTGPHYFFYVAPENEDQKAQSNVQIVNRGLALWVDVDVCEHN